MAGGDSEIPSRWIALPPIDSYAAKDSSHGSVTNCLHLIGRGSRQRSNDRTDDLVDDFGGKPPRWLWQFRFRAGHNPCHRLAH